MKTICRINFGHWRPALLLAISITVLLLCACAQSQDGKTLTGYITIQDGKVILDEVEIITEEDTDRIQELGLTFQGDLVSGYYLYNESEETLTFDLTDQTKYRFVDMGQLYTTLEDSESLAYETTSLEEFLNGSCYSASVSADDQAAIPTHPIPYIVEVLDGCVVSITEEFRFTI